MIKPAKTSAAGSHFSYKNLPIAWKRVIFLATGAGAVLTVITVSPQAWRIVEPLAPAHREFVREEVKPLEQKTNLLQYNAMRDSLNKFKVEEGGWSIQYAKETDPAAKNLIQQQLERTRVEQNRLITQMQAINVPSWAR